MRLQTLGGLVALAATASACALVLGDFDKVGGTGGTTSTSGSTGSSSSSGTACTMDTDCNDQNVCTTDTCNTATSTCTNSAIPDGPPPGYTDTVMDCKTQRCVSGMEQTLAADTDVPPSGNPCVTNTCANQMVIPTNVTAGMGCGGTQTCDGMGNCVGCIMAGDCMNPGTCKSVACTANKCIISNDPVETTCNGGGKVVCDGNGNCVGCATNGDCTSGNCTNNTCGLASDGHACTAGNQCQNGFCNSTTMKCATPTCTDGFMNGNETDVDCGGGTCPACGTGKMCAKGSDCTSDTCNGGHTCN